MVGSPGQTVECLVEDFEFLQELKPHMIGIGPFLAHQDTPFGAEENGSYEQTLLLLSIRGCCFLRRQHLEQLHRMDGSRDYWQERMY